MMLYRLYGIWRFTAFWLQKTGAITEVKPAKDIVEEMVKEAIEVIQTNYHRIVASKL